MQFFCTKYSTVLYCSKYCTVQYSARPGTVLYCRLRTCARRPHVFLIFVCLRGWVMPTVLNNHVLGFMFIKCAGQLLGLAAGRNMIMMCHCDGVNASPHCCPETQCPLAASGGSYPHALYNHQPCRGDRLFRHCFWTREFGAVTHRVCPGEG